MDKGESRLCTTGRPAHGQLAGLAYWDSLPRLGRLLLGSPAQDEVTEETEEQNREDIHVPEKMERLIADRQIQGETRIVVVKWGDEMEKRPEDADQRAAGDTLGETYGLKCWSSAERPPDGSSGALGGVMAVSSPSVRAYRS